MNDGTKEETMARDWKTEYILDIARRKLKETNKRMLNFERSYFELRRSGSVGLREFRRVLKDFVMGD